MTALMEAPTVSAYALGHSENEQQRLEEQGAVLRPATERWLREAGLGAGMRILDVGCGTGAVTRLAAGLVGPTGTVLGVDRSADVIATAHRAAAARDLTQVAFAAADINDFAPDRPVDALIGRLVLMYQPDPAATLRHLARSVRPGGIVAFADYVFSPPLALPPRPLYAQAYGWAVETVRRSTPNADLGARLHRVYADAGLPEPVVRYEVVAAIGVDPAFERLVADVVRSVLPLAEELGVVSAAEADVGTLLARMVAEAEATDGVTFGPVLATATTRLPG